MLLNSLGFLWFFPLASAAYFAAPPRLCTPVLIAASLWFYATWNIGHVLVLGGCIGAAWLGGRLMEHFPNKHHSALLVAAALIPLGMLVIFKYYAFLVDTVQTLGNRMGKVVNLPMLDLALPVGISFFTFKALSYLIDVYRGKMRSERSLLNVAAYISFFPQILAGPIERAGNFIPQLDRKHPLNAQSIADGLALMLWGLFQKMVIADNLATIVNWVYLAPRNYTGLPLIVATYAYAFQIYADFAGYSNMAIGAARVLGFSTMKNFDRPYASLSVSEFWRRWHISLSTWFRDYLYIPLGGNRVGPWRWTLNVLIVFLVSGLWHGSYWTFIIWGGLHGLFLVAERLLFPSVGAVAGLRHVPRCFPCLYRVFRMLLTFHMVTFAWIFFRARTVTDACYVAGHLFADINRQVQESLAVFNAADLVRGGMLIAVLIGVESLCRGMSSLQWLRRRPEWVRWIAYAALLLALINLRPEYNTGFIYSQF